MARLIVSTLFLILPCFIQAQEAAFRKIQGPLLPLGGVVFAQEAQNTLEGYIHYLEAPSMNGKSYRAFLNRQKNKALQFACLISRSFNNLTS